MSNQNSGGRESTAQTDAVSVRASDKQQWLSRRRAATELGIDVKSVPRVAIAAMVRMRKMPGVTRQYYFLPDIQRVARESIKILGQTGTAKPQ